MPQNGNIAVLVVAILGIIKLTTEILGYSFITDEQINKYANFISTIAAVAGVYLNNRKPPVDGSNKVTNINTFTPKD